MILLKALEFIPKQIHRAYSDFNNQREYKSQKFSPNERTVEFRFVFESLQRAAPKTILDIGTGTTALPHLMRNCGYEVTALDNITDYWPRGRIARSMHNPHYHVVDDNILNPKISGKFDFLTCISVLEHIEDHDLAVSKMASLTKPGGHIVITCPFTEANYIKDCYRLEGSMVKRHPGYVCQSYSRKNIEKWTTENGLELVGQEFWKCWTGPAWTIGDKLFPAQKSSANQLHQHSCMIFEKK